MLNIKVKNNEVVVDCNVLCVVHKEAIERFRNCKIACLKDFANVCKQHNLESSKALLLDILQQHLHNCFFDTTNEEKEHYVWNVQERSVDCYNDFLNHFEILKSNYLSNMNKMLRFKVLCYETNKKVDIVVYLDTNNEICVAIDLDILANIEL